MRDFEARNFLYSCERAVLFHFAKTHNITIRKKEVKNSSKPIAVLNRSEMEHIAELMRQYINNSQTRYFSYSPYMNCLENLEKQIQLIEKELA